MPFTDLLVHRCEVFRRPPDSKNRLGEPVERWESVEQDIACRVTAARGGERNTERMRETYNVTHEMFILPGLSTMKEDDEVSVTDPDGNTVLSRARIVLMRKIFTFRAAPHHVEVMLEHLRGPSVG